MKKVSIICAGLMLAVFCFGQKMEKVALVSIQADKKISQNWQGYLLEDILAKVFGSNFSVQEKVDEFRDLMLKDIAEELPFDFIPEKEVLDNEDYQTIVVANKEYFVSPNGYMRYDPISKKDDLLAAFPEVDGIMVIDLTYRFEGNTLVLNTGSGTAKVAAVMVMKVFNREGKAVLKVKSVGYSEQKLAVAMGVITKGAVEEIPIALDQASKALVEDVKSDLPKRLAKMHKKLK
jgi:hypothetical protein